MLVQCRREAVKSAAWVITVARLKLKGIGGGSTTRGEACGSIGVNAGNLTGGDSRVKVKLKTLLDKLRGGAWPSPGSCREVSC